MSLSGLNQILVRTCSLKLDSRCLAHVVVDFGCSGGGQIFCLTKRLPDDLILVQKVRHKVANFVAEKINSLCNNSACVNYTNLGVVCNNSMKKLHNYFLKKSDIFVADVDYYMSHNYLLSNFSEEARTKV